MQLLYTFPSIQAKSKPPTAANISIASISKVLYLSQASIIIFFFLFRPSSESPPPLPTTSSIFFLVTEYKSAELDCSISYYPFQPFENTS